ncbi:MAG: 30S ribosomal protein S12 methylthiotransferase RimO [Oscillospiraceae bacterium]|jgi:ribosomal protein S12 methylthiotransferase|nr:30S ribosomal protein S12 methylthiotransferase RimO [Oscillospiraceae bacterium]
MSNRIAVISLGCAKNQVNAEQMLYLLREAGYEITAELTDVQVVIINTCGFIDSAKSEAIDNILAMGALKKAGHIEKILVTGCLSQRYREEILKEMPEVDGVLGTGSYGEIVSAVESLLSDRAVCSFGNIHAPVDEVGRILTTPKHYAYLKIAEGCDNHCAYCVIPSLRGKFRSRTMEDCLHEARLLAQDGVKELIVVAQDTSRYGIDLYGERRLPQLLRELCKIEKLHWIRVHYLYPDEMSDELIEVIAGEPKIVNYLDIPIQHVNDTILKRMNRRTTKAELSALIAKLRAAMPDAVIRTSLITGLPGEGEAEFAELCRWLREHRLERVGAFSFSPEEGTPAARMQYPDEQIAVRRAEILGDLQAEIMDAHNASLVGKTLEVLCEGYDAQAQRYFGRSFADSPDIDGRVCFTAKAASIGEFYWVDITGVYDADLLGIAREDAER